MCEQVNNKTENTYKESQTTADTVENCSLSGTCWHLLPCGICKLTNAPCPKAGTYQPWTIPGSNPPSNPSYPYITWTSQDH